MRESCGEEEGEYVFGSVLDWSVGANTFAAPQVADMIEQLLPTHPKLLPVMELLRPGYTARLVIGVFPMKGETIADLHSEVTHYDVLVRPDGGDPLEEHENLTRLERDEVVKAMEERYPGASPNYDCVDLLQ